MTLIAAFRAGLGDDGIALCADSQETVTQDDGHGGWEDVRVAVQKIEPIIRTDELHISIAGAGNADLIDGFIARAKRVLASAPGLDNIAAVRDAVEDQLHSFYKNHVVLCPDADKNIKLFIAVSCPKAKQFGMWESNYDTLSEPKFPAIIGYVHGMYAQTASRFAKLRLPLSQAALASVYTLTVAKETSNHVGGNLSLAVIKPTGIFEEDQTYVRQLEERLSAYERYMTVLLLAAADTSVYAKTLAEGIERFGKTIRELHEQQISEVLEKSWKRGDEHCSGYPIERVPPGILVEKGTDGTRVVRHDVIGLEEVMRRINEANKLADERNATQSNPQKSEDQQ